MTVIMPDHREFEPPAQGRCLFLVSDDNLTHGDGGRSGAYGVQRDVAVELPETLAHALRTTTGADTKCVVDLKRCAVEISLVQLGRCQIHTRQGHLPEPTTLSTVGTHARSRVRPRAWIRRFRDEASIPHRLLGCLDFHRRGLVDLSFRQRLSRWLVERRESLLLRQGLCV
ncbi:hypothetical protein ACWDTQ_32515 [Streptomyces cellulosae]